MNIKAIFKTVFEHALDEGIVENNLSFADAVKMQCDNYDGSTEEELYEMFANGEYWHALQILDYASPSIRCFYFIDSIQGEDEIEEFIRKLESATNGAWVLNGLAFENDGNAWMLKLDDNFGGTSIALPEESYFVGGEIATDLLAYLDSLQLTGSFVVRGGNTQSAYFLSSSLLEKLKSSGVLDKQGDPASEFY